MSLIDDSLIQAYYNNVNPRNENSAVSFWTYIFKRYFSEDHFSYDGQQPASQTDPLRRVDGRLSYVEQGTSHIMVLFFHEAKKTSQAMTEMHDVEGQAFEACGTFLSEHTELTHVYAVTTIGTEARIWKYQPGGNIQGVGVSDNSGVRTAYIEANSPNAVNLRNALSHIKQFPPSIYATRSAISSQTTAYQAPQVAYQAPQVAYQAPQVAYQAPQVAYPPPQTAYPASQTTYQPQTVPQNTHWKQSSQDPTRWWRMVNGQIEWN